MSKKLIWSLAAAALILAACDDITNPPADPRAHEETVPPAPESAQVVTKLTVVSTYNLIFETANELMAWQSKLEPLYQHKDIHFTQSLNSFNEFSTQRIAMLKARAEMISPVDNKVPKDHPAAKLWQAIQLELRIFDDFVYHYKLNRTLHPKLLNELTQDLNDFQTQFRAYDKWPETKTTPPTIKR